MHGYQREELIGKTIADVLAPEDLPRLEKARETLLVPGQDAIARSGRTGTRTAIAFPSR